jgi:hypothetical protein
MIYGAHGQPLGPMLQPGQDPSYPPPPPPNYLPGPYPGPGYDDRGDRGAPPPHAHDQVSRKRPRADEPSHPAVPPPPPPQAASSHPHPQQQQQPPPPPPPPQQQPQPQRLTPTAGARRSSAGAAFEYPDPTHMAPVSPASSTTSYQSTAYTPQATVQPYYPTPPAPRRSSPQSQSQSAYPYDARASGSPHGSTSSASGYATFAGGLHPPQVLPPQRESRRSPPPGPSREGNNGGNGSRAGMSVRDMLGPGDGQGGRSSADSDMLNTLNRRAM